MTTHLLSQRRSSRTGAVLLLLGLLLALGFAWHGPIAQWPDYHRFADRRTLAGIPNAADVLSNLAFAAAGLWGLWRTRKTPATGLWFPAWSWFSWSLVATAIGSACYHWAPNDTALVFDRLPIAWACSSLLCAFLAERLDERWSRPSVLAAAAILASASVAVWWWGLQRGSGDLRAYLFVQALPMLLVPAGLLTRRERRLGTTPAPAWWAVLGGYAAAKLFELGDGPVFGWLGFVSGHTLKHLIAAAAAFVLLRAALSSGSRR